MKKNISLLFYILCTCFYTNLLNAQLPVDHDLNVTINKDNPIACFALNGTSNMFVGVVDKDFLRMEKILVLEDGEITLDVNLLNSNEDLEFKLTNAANTNEYFKLLLNNNTLQLLENYNGQSHSYNLGNYQVGNSLRIIRCSDKIIYRINGNTVHIRSLVDNNFEMYGEVSVHNTAGVDFEATVTFHPL